MPRKSDERQRAILAAVEQLVGESGRPPTPGEIAAATGIPLTSVRYHAASLVQSGRLRRVYGGRGLELVPREGQS